MPKFLFNRTPLVYGEKHEQPDDKIIKNTLGLFRASLEDAVKFGGDFTREVLSTVPLVGDRKNIIVDTKIHMLMPGMFPSIAEIHTDGVPRDESFRPSGKGKPNIWLQNQVEARKVRYHLLVTGNGCLTDFIPDPLELELPAEPTTDLYKIISSDPKVKSAPRIKVPSCQWVSWDWFSLHEAVAASVHEWRFLVRVCETDYQEPNKDLRDILRQTQNVYLPANFGW